MRKSLKEISDPITEAEYRADGRIHYSTLSTFNRTGFNGLETLFDRKYTPSLTFGSAVDAIITGGMDEFESLYYISDIGKVPPSIIQMINDIFNIYGASTSSLDDLSDDVLAKYWEKYDDRRWMKNTEAKKIREYDHYYKSKFLAYGKTIISNETYNDVLAAVRALKESEATKWYFQMDFDDDIERLYQLKFHASFNGMDFSCMMDEVIVDHENKLIYPIDLKTSSHKEHDFHQSFIDWGYHIQARLYWRILRENLKKDEYFKDFTLMDYRFIVVNKFTLNPLVWEFTEVKEYGTLQYGKNKNILFRDPFDLAEELTFYLNDRPIVPRGINTDAMNNIKHWLDTL